MPSQDSERKPFFRARFAALCAAPALVLAAGGGASATPSLTLLHSFGGLPGNGPAAGLLADSSGNLYGTTSGGGAANNGVVFKLSPDGTLTVLHSFTGAPGDGACPLATLLADSSGNLYGTTEEGGASGFGVVFTVSPSGTETVLHSFIGSPSDGREPRRSDCRQQRQSLWDNTARRCG